MAMNRDEEVRTEITEAARRVFQKWGLNKSTMEDIAREAGKGKSTLYNYFSSKEEILEVLAMSEMKRIVEISQGASSGSTTAKERLRVYISSQLLEIKKTVGLYPFIMGDLKGDRAFIKRLREQIDQYEERAILAILEAGISSGEYDYLKPEKAKKAATVLVEILRGLEIYLVLDNDDPEKLEIASAMISNGV
jgi:AcrR family transcriptional regulator